MVDKEPRTDALKACQTIETAGSHARPAVFALARTRRLTFLSIRTPRVPRRKPFLTRIAETAALVVAVAGLLPVLRPARPKPEWACMGVYRACHFARLHSATNWTMNLSFPVFRERPATTRVRQVQANRLIAPPASFFIGWNMRPYQICSAPSCASVSTMDSRRN